jgi:hypothetical protein
MKRELVEKSPGVAMRQQSETFCVEFISGLILVEDTQQIRHHVYRTTPLPA